MKFRLLLAVACLSAACYGQSFGTLTQYNSGTCASSTSCNVSSVTFANGDMAIITAVADDSGISIASVAGQTCVRTNAWAFSVFNGSTDQCVILSTSAITGSTLTVNFNTTTGGSLVNIRRYPVVSGTPAIDAVNSDIVSSASSITEVPLTISGTSAVAVEAVGNGGSSISSPWTDVTTLSGGAFSGFLSADQINASSVATPTFSGSSMNGVVGTAVSFSPATPVQFALMDSSGGTATVEPTATTLLNSTYGAAYLGSSNVNTSFTVTDTVGGEIAYEGSTGDTCGNAHRTLYGTNPRFLYSGVTYPNTSTLGLAFTWGNTSENATVGFNLPGAVQYFNLESPTVTMSADFCTTMLPTDSESGGDHTFTISKSGNDGPNLAIVANGSSLFFQCESGATGSCLNGLNSSTAATLPIYSGTWYKLNFQVNGGFVQQSPTSPSSLSVGSNTITLTACPFNPNTPYYIAGTGTGEFAIPTATTCASNGASGTVTLTMVGTHSSGYTIQTADVATVLSDKGVLLKSFYYAGATTASYAYLMRIGIPNNPSGLSSRTIYYSNVAYCYATISPAICPTVQTPLPTYPWTGILTANRAMDWTGAGLPATFPDGETTANPWTPPIRSTQYSTTINPSGVAATDLSNINTAKANCPNGEFVLLGAGTFLIQGIVNTATHECTVRGSGPQSTILAVSGSGLYDIGSTTGGGHCAITSAANLSLGSQTLICSSLSGSAPVVGNVAVLTQCDTGYTGNPCTGTAADNGGIYVCGGQSGCNTDGSGPGNSFNNQSQVFYITSVSNVSGTYTIGLDKGLYMPNWAFGQTPILNWNNPADDAIGEGLEDLSIVYTGSGNEAVQEQYAYASWVKGVRFIGGGSNASLIIGTSKSDLVINDYFFVDQALDANYPPAIRPSQTSDLLITNNQMFSESEPVEGYGGNSGDVMAYNFARDTFTQYPFNNSYDHVPFDSLELWEGNQFGEYVEDNTWGTHAIDTYFRNLGVCYDSPYTTYTLANSRAFQQDNFQRFMNVIGNAFGSSQCTNYQAATGNGYIYQIATSDALSGGSLMRWGNCDTVSSPHCRNVNSEVPSALTGNAAPLQVPVPASTNLPCSFFVSALAGTSCTPSYTGTTTFSWWSVCKTWTTFPTACSATQSQPFPVAGPELTSGPYVNGYAYDTPAAIAWENLPIDTTYQSSYTIASSSYSPGFETLTVTSLPDTTCGGTQGCHTMGAFQLSGVNSACTMGAFMPGANSEILMTGSTATTVTYALASNPGVSCTGTFKFPDIRQFDERVFDASSPAATGSSSLSNGAQLLNGAVAQ